MGTWGRKSHPHKRVIGSHARPRNPPGKWKQIRREEIEENRNLAQSSLLCKETKKNDLCSQGFLKPKNGQLKEYTALKGMHLFLIKKGQLKPFKTLSQAQKGHESLRWEKTLIIVVKQKTIKTSFQRHRCRVVSIGTNNDTMSDSSFSGYVQN